LIHFYKRFAHSKYFIFITLSFYIVYISTEKEQRYVSI